MAVPLWQPDPARIEQSQLRRFIDYINAHYAASLGGDYAALHAWSIAQPSAFWSSIWAFGKVVASARGDTVLLDGDKFPGARWFPDAQLNFAENLLRYRDDRVALVSLFENGSRRQLTYAQLHRHVARLACALRGLGVVAGDRVVGLMPNVQETVVAMLAATSIGAIWSSCSPDFGFDGVLDRFGQIAPKVLFAADGYWYNGKAIDTLPRIAELSRALDTLESVVVVPLLQAESELDTALTDFPGASTYASFVAEGNSCDDTPDLHFAQLPFDHPLYVMYSSGTTGKPKCIVHGAGGTLLQHLKEHQLHVDLCRDDVFFYFTTCGWMMWNWLVSGLATGATLLLYDGAPMMRDGQVLLDAIDSEGISVFGTSARFIAALEKAGALPRKSHELQRLRSILSTGSPLSHESFEYVYRDIKADVCLSSISGGTDIVSCFVGGCPILPVYSGQIQAAGLGMAVEIRNEAGQPVVQEKGELVCTRPFPSTPLGFWGDSDDSRFHAAYFSRFPNVWAHGDYGEITAEHGFVIHGRSDAVLNPGGVRIGTAEIYRQVERVPAVLESVVIGQQWQGDVRVILFVVLRDEVALDAELEKQIRQTIRKHTTPRHVPAKIIQVADIPRTLSGKIVELAVRDVVHGKSVSNSDALANPQALTLFADLPSLRE